LLNGALVPQYLGMIIAKLDARPNHRSAKPFTHYLQL